MLSPFTLSVALWVAGHVCPMASPPPPPPPKAVIQPIGPPTGVRPWTPKTPTTNKKG